jgi:glycosyltransferase involved in cell wall biosynthesis
VAGNDVGSFAESIASLLDDRGLARSLGASGRSYWERRLTPAAVAERHLQIYETMLA